MQNATKKVPESTTVHPLEWIERNPQVDAKLLPVLTPAAIEMGKLRQGCIVKFRGMVQDVLDPELVTSSNESAVETTIYKERIPLRCIPVPGQTHWCTASYNPTSFVERERLKENTDVKKGNKRTQEDMEEDMTNVKKTSVEKTSEAVASGEAPTKSRNFDCIVHVYDGSQIKVCQMYEFIGMLDILPRGIDDPAQEELFSRAIDQFTPRLHVLRSTNLTFRDLIPSSPSPATLPLEAIRSKLICYLATHLHQDFLAAEYLLLSLIGHLHKRIDDLPLGLLPLNLLFDAQDEELADLVDKMDHLLQELLPTYRSIPLSISNLCASQFTPAKDYDQEFLHRGVLQLVDGTMILIDETQLKPGQLTDIGLQNLGALSKAIKQQQLNYDFQYYNLDFPIEVRPIVVSAKKSILKIDLQLQIVKNTAPRPSCVEHVDETITPELLALFRDYIGSCFAAEFKVEDGETKVAEDYYIEQRQIDKTIADTDLHRWLNLTRLIGKSFGKASLTEDMWEYMLDLESQRKARSTLDRA